MTGHTLSYQRDLIARRIKGEAETDEWGMDWEFQELIRPFLDFLYSYYWRVEVSGMDNVPDHERTLIVSNHSGQLPWDGVMLIMSLLNDHPAQRQLRLLQGDWFARLPLLSMMMAKIGGLPESEENGVKLLSQDEIVAIFPEGDLGLGKPFRERYRLARFGRSDAIKMALKTGSPIIPAAIVGAEETHVTVSRSATLGSMVGLPYFPISLRFPWFGLFGTIPLPTKWFIDFGEPIYFEKYGPAEVDQPVLVSRLADKVRAVVQELVANRVAQRSSVFC